MQQTPETGQSPERDRALDRLVAEGGARSLDGAKAKVDRWRSFGRRLMRLLPQRRALRALEDLRSHIDGTTRLVTPETLLTEERTDRMEDEAGLRFAISPNTFTREAYIRALHAQAAESLALARDLEAQRRKPS